MDDKDTSVVVLFPQSDQQLMTSAHSPVLILQALLPLVSGQSVEQQNHKARSTPCPSERGAVGSSFSVEKVQAATGRCFLEQEVPRQAGWGKMFQMRLHKCSEEKKLKLKAGLVASPLYAGNQGCRPDTS